MDRSSGRTYTADQTISHVAQYFGVDHQTATSAYLTAAGYLRNAWQILDQADHDEIIDTIATIVDLSDEE